ncbi:HindVP family restriction endonuclease [uncultured Dubosiella sp.]|uniref:HindVP family restriction endonuclease n=1 Tax=uncultured Dubosiella sp. TaxID=1937011 RepID=UPI00262C5604|nr:HindVP family restriction endonuclease [uncultured Dubosiella sp.]
MDTGLFGLFHSNRGKDDHWGKNCFNSSFPASLCCYLLDNKKSAMYAKVRNSHGKLVPHITSISIREAFNMSDSMTLKDIYFDFESVYQPFRAYAYGEIDGIDLVIRHYPSMKYLRPLEVKLTVMPDSTTFSKPQDQWGCEIVIRPATMEYIALSLFDNTKEYRSEIFEIFDPYCREITDWTNETEIVKHLESLKEALEFFVDLFIDYQKPLVLQTIWKTQGREPILEEQAFDVLFWSDMGFTRLFMSKSLVDGKERITRPGRAIARLVRCLWELAKNGKIDTKAIYREMAYSKQSDKEFSVSGTAWRPIVDNSRLNLLSINKNILTTLIQPGYISRLQPERRFDQTLYYSFKEEENTQK